MVVSKGALTAQSHCNPFVLPNGWEWIELNEAFAIRRGTINPFKNPSKQFELYSIPAYDKGIRPDLVHGKDVRSAKTVVSKGDILFSKLNPRIPRVWIVKDNENLEQIASTEFIPLIPKRNADDLPYFDPDFARVLFLSNIVRNQLTHDVQGATGSRQRLRLQNLKAARLPRPLSLEVQRRIVARLETLMTEIKRARQIIDQMRDDSRRVLEAALNKIFPSQAFKKAGWTEEEVSEFCWKPQYGYTAAASTEPVGPKFLRITDIQNSRVDWDSVPFCQIPAGKIKKYILTPGDILFARSGATTGKTFLVRECPKAVFASYLIRLRVRERIIPEFLIWFFQSSSYWEQISKRGAAQPNMNATLLSQLRVCYPTSEHKQQNIVSYLNSIHNEVDKILNSIDTDTKVLDQLEQSIFEGVFRGEL